MAEQKKDNTPPKKESNNPFSKLTGKDPKKPKFNFYWIYGILAVVFIGIQFLNWGGTAEKTDWRALKDMLYEGDVEKIILVNKETAEIYIKPDRLNQEKYKDVNKDQHFGQQTAHYYYNVADPATFMEDVQETQEGMDLTKFM